MGNAFDDSGAWEIRRIALDDGLFPKMRDAEFLSSAGFGTDVDVRTKTVRSIEIVGEVDFSVAARVRSLLEGHPDLRELDLSQVRFIDASIINELVRCAKRVAPRKIAIVGAQPHVRRLLRLLQLDDAFAYGERASEGASIVWRSGIE